MKTIAIIGGMGPQASIHANSRLLNKLINFNKTANIVHISLDLEPFHSNTPSLQLTSEQKLLLKSLKADLGFIACNTAHHFFNEFQDLVNFELVNFLEITNLPKHGIIFCSPTSRNLKLFGNKIEYANDTQTKRISKIIHRVNSGGNIPKGELKTIIGEAKLPIFACTEISMVAFNEKIKGTDTLEQTINEVIRRIK